MLRIRLSRVGKRKQPAYRIVVADSRSPRDGSFLKIIGHYNPLAEPATLVVKEEEAVHWLQKGAKPSETAAKLLTRLGVMEKAGREPFVHEPKVTPPKAKKKGEREAAPQAAAAPEAKAAEPAPEAEAPAEPAPEAEAPAEPAPETEAPPEPAAEASEAAAEPEAEAEAPAEEEAEEKPEPGE